MLPAGESVIIIAARTRAVERGLQVTVSAPYFEVSQAAQLAERQFGNHPIAGTGGGGGS